MIKKCYKCKSKYEGNYCPYCNEELCNSCLKKFKVKEMSLKYRTNCLKCAAKIEKIEKDTDGVYMKEVKFFHKDWSKHGVEVYTKRAKDLIKVEKEGRKDKICDFRLKEVDI